MCILILNIPSPVQNVQFMPTLLCIPRHFAQNISLRIHVLAILSDFNFVECVLSQMDPALLSFGMVRALGSYVEWILAESKVSLPVYALAKYSELIHAHLSSE